MSALSNLYSRMTHFTIRVALIATALWIPAALAAESISLNVNGSGSLGAPSGVTTFSGTGTGSSTPFGATSFSTSGTVDTSGVAGFSGTASFDFGSGNALDASFSESSGTDTSAIPTTITGGTGLFDSATGSLVMDFNGFPTSTVSATFTLTATGNVTGPNLSGPSSAAPEPGSLLLVSALPLIFLLRRRRRAA